MKKLLVVIMLCISLISCQDNNSNRVTAEKQEKIMQEVNRQVGMPSISNFQEKKLAKMIFELRDKEDLITYTYITAKNTGKQQLLCKSMGYGLPYSVQYTNPQIYHVNGTTLPQADPNGLFMSEGLSATWVMCIDGKGEPKPVYVENEIMVFPFQL